MAKPIIKFDDFTSQFMSISGHTEKDLCVKAGVDVE
jgi:hypothetical protein